MSGSHIDIHSGSAPLVINIPHDGREIPAHIAAKMSKDALLLPDTDWHVRDLYEFAKRLGATITVARYSRYVVDLNRAPDGRSLYPGLDTTELCPSKTFHAKEIYLDGQYPAPQETNERLERYWRPYHAELLDVVDQQRKKFGAVLLLDAHSIHSLVPRLFDGRLPDFNLGTVDGKSASSDLIQNMYEVLEKAEGYSACLDGRFKGGYITRHYGDPARGIHAVQLEVGQACYMEGDFPFRVDLEKFERLKSILSLFLESGLNWLVSNSKP